MSQNYVRRASPMQRKLSVEYTCLAKAVFSMNLTVHQFHQWKRNYLYEVSLLDHIKFTILQCSVLILITSLYHLTIPESISDCCMNFLPIYKIRKLCDNYNGIVYNILILQIYHFKYCFQSELCKTGITEAKKTVCRIYVFC